MYTNPNVNQMLGAVVNTLRQNVLPHIMNPEAVREAEMCLAVLQWAERLAPVEQQLYGQEAGEMHVLFVALSRLFGADCSPEGRRIQERGHTLEANGTLAMPAYEELVRTHRTLSQALIPTLDDLHALESRGHAMAAQGLAIVRAHLACRSGRDLKTYLGLKEPDAMVGRE